MRENLVKKVAGKAAAYCARRERTVQDVRGYIGKYDLSEREGEEIISTLLSNDFINEGRYARAYTSDKFRFNQWGRNKLRHALRMKKVREEYIEQAVEALPAREYEETALKLIKSKIRAMPRLSALDRKARVVRFMIGKGYEPEFVYELLNGLEM